MSLADYKLNPDFADVDEIQRYFSDIARRLVRAENQEALIQAATRALIEFGLQRVDESLAPAIERLQLASELGFLVASSATSLTLATGEAVFEIDEAQRELFTPTPVLTITREAEGAESEYAVARLTSYDPETGGLVVDVQTISDIAGAHDDWVIAASAGLAPAIIELAAAAIAAKDLAVPAAATATTKAAEALASALAAAASAEAAALFDPSSYYTKGEVDSEIGDAISVVLDSAPGALDTLNELAAALGDDANFATTVTNALANKLESVAFSDIVAAAIASQSEVRSGTASKLLTTTAANASLDFVNLTDGGTIAFDMADGVNRKVTLGGNRTLGQITNAVVGQTFAIEVSQPGSSSTRTLSYHGSYVTPSGGITIKTGNNQKTLLVGMVLAASSGTATKTFITAAGDGWTS